jgi:hypothetical protein
MPTLPHLLLRCLISMIESRNRPFFSPTLYGSFFVQMFKLILSGYLTYLLISFIDFWLFIVMIGYNFGLSPGLVSLFGQAQQTWVFLGSA